MEAAGLSIGILSIVGNLLRTYRLFDEYLTTCKDFHSDRSDIFLRLEDENTRTMQLRDLLFVRHGAAHSLFEQLDPQIQKQMFSLFTRFGATVEAYMTLDVKYQIPLDESACTGESLLSDTMRDLISCDTTLNKRPRITASASTTNHLSWRGRLRWWLKDKDKMLRLLDEIQSFNTKIKEAIEIQLIKESLRHRSTEFVPNEHQRRNGLHALGITDTLHTAEDARRFNDSGLLEAPIRSTYVHWKDVCPSIDVTLSFLARYQNRAVLLDKPRRLLDDPFRPSSKDNGTRLDQLTCIMKDLSKMHPMVLDCTGWTRLTEDGASFLYELPLDAYIPTEKDSERDVAEPESSKNLSPRSLFSILPSKWEMIGPPLEERYQLAYNLSSFMERVHTVSWVHKSFRSDSVVFFHSKTKESSPPSLPPLCFVTGFEYARPLDSASSLRIDSDFSRNIYRHPERWGIPTIETPFGQIHDIYALGVVLLEIGLWRQAESLIQVRNTLTPRPVEVKAALIQRANRHLVYVAGKAYTEVTLRCLQGGFDGEVVQDFRSTVVERLQRLARPELVSVCGEGAGEFDFRVSGDD